MYDIFILQIYIFILQINFFFTFLHVTLYSFINIFKFSKSEYKKIQAVIIKKTEEKSFINLQESQKGLISAL